MATDVRTINYRVTACEHLRGKMTGVLADGTPFYTYKLSVAGTSTLKDAIHPLEDKCHACGHEIEIEVCDGTD